MPSRKGYFLAQVGAVIIIAILALGFWLFAIGGVPFATRVVSGDSRAHQLTISSTSTPAVPLSLSNITLNSASNIVLIANATKTVTVTFTVSGGSGGCGNVFYSGGNVTTTLYRSGVSSSCGVANPGTSVLNTLNCYVIATTTNNCASPASTSSANATASIDVWYFADATDSSSTYSAQNWLASVFVQNASGTSVSTSTPSASGQELLMLLALALPSSTLNYGTLTTGTDTSSTNQISAIKNAGNSSTTLKINGTAMTSGANKIATSSQHYATSTFTFGGAEQTLQEAATAVAGFLIPRPLLTSWATTTPIGAVTYWGSAVGNNGYIYLVGGDVGPASNATSSVFFAVANANGTLGSWSSTSPLPSPRELHVSVVNNNYLYAIGGTATNATYAPASTVYFAPINSTGSVGTWSSTTILPGGGVHGFGAAVYNGYLYVAGGNLDGFVTETSTVRFALINSTGSIGAWTNTTALPYPLGLFSFGAANGYLYAIGGNPVTPPARTSTVLFALINSTGSIGAWTSTTALPYGLENQMGAVFDNGIIYPIGGKLTDSTKTSTVLFNPQKTGGALGIWSLGTPLPVALDANIPTVWNGYLYNIGGVDPGSNVTSTVSFTSLASRNTYWGWSVPGGSAAGSYSSTIAYTAVFSP